MIAADDKGKQLWFEFSWCPIRNPNFAIYQPQKRNARSYIHQAQVAYRTSTEVLQALQLKKDKQTQKTREIGVFVEHIATPMHGGFQQRGRVYFQLLKDTSFGLFYDLDLMSYIRASSSREC